MIESITDEEQPAVTVATTDTPISDAPSLGRAQLFTLFSHGMQQYARRFDSLMAPLHTVFNLLHKLPPMTPTKSLLCISLLIDLGLAVDYLETGEFSSVNIGLASLSNIALPVGAGLMADLDWNGSTLEANNHP